MGWKCTSITHRSGVKYSRKKKHKYEKGEVHCAPLHRYGTECPD